MASPSETTDEPKATPSEAEDAAREAPGFLGKPAREKGKLLALFCLIAILVRLSSPSRRGWGVGAILVAIGATIRVWAAGHLTRDQKLTTSGPYAYSRNPFYLGRLFLLLGFAVMSGLGFDLKQKRNVVVWAIVIGALAFFFLGYMPRKEEREGGRLEEMFGDDYREWKENVPSLFPRATPYVMNPRPWSYDLFRAGDGDHSGNKEGWTTLATAALSFAFYLRRQGGF
jgi:protein-S-isoprenylcysteine O-methyltransferase Ste14